MHKLEVKLKQHTPLIHFQHDQEGATLRASEVKPKLDRFIITKLGNGNYVEGKILAKNNCWLVGNGEHGALDYKIKINAIEVDTYIIPDKFPLFFGNMGDDNPQKEFRFTEKPVTVFFDSFDKEIINRINDFFAEFLLLNNFGTRQSKGFGSFYIDNTDPLFKPPVQTQFLDYRFKVNVDSKDWLRKWGSLCEHIDLFYKTLRSGINICNRNGESIFYIKSIMFKYAKDRGFQWDKKSIKEHYLAMDLRAQKENHFDESDVLNFSQGKGEKYLFKDMLGLSSTESWRSYRKTITKESDRRKEDEKYIDRFMSPILFKPIYNQNGNNYEVLFKGIEVPQNYKNENFKIINSNQRSLSLKTYPDFDIDEFLDYAIFEVDLENLLGDPNYLDNPKYKIIENIFNQIRKDYE